MQPPPPPPPNPSAPAPAASRPGTPARPGQIQPRRAWPPLPRPCGTIVLAIIGSGQPSTANTAPGTSSTATVTHQPAAPTATATLAPRTATPGQSPGPAVLGGTGQAFIGKYGPLVASQSDTSR